MVLLSTQMFPTLGFAQSSPFLDPLTSESNYLDGSTQRSSNGARNTGTEVFLGDAGQVVQFSVIDGANGGIYWKEFSGTTGALLFSDLTTYDPTITNLKDPDIAVVRAEGGQRYLVVVGINPQDNHVYFYNFEIFCDGTETVPKIGLTFLEHGCQGSMTHKLGSALTPSQSTTPVRAFGDFMYWPLIGTPTAASKDYMFSRICKSPNVDANEGGQVVITWIEEALVGTPFITTTDFRIFMGLAHERLAITWRQGNVMSASGNISDLCYSGGCDTPNSIDDNYLVSGGSFGGGLNPGNPIAQKYEKHRNNYIYTGADVSISQKTESGESYVSYAYVRFTNRLIESPRNPTLITAQLPFGECMFSGNGVLTDTARSMQVKYKEDWENVIGDWPRIASTNELSAGDIEDFVVSLSSFGAQYDCSINTVFTSGSLGLYWYKDGNYGLRVANDNVDITSKYASNAAIAYNSGQDLVTLVWSGFEDGYKIIAKDYYFNGTDQLYDMGTSYSFVSDPAGQEHNYPSVASRNTGETLVRGYFWVDPEASPDVFYSRLALDIAGVDQLGTVGGAYMQGFCVFEIDPDAVGGTFPNPASSLKDIVIKDKTVTRVEVYSSLNQMVSVSSVSDGKLTNNTTSKLPQGLYTIKMVTPTGTRISKLVIQ